MHNNWYDKVLTLETRDEKRRAKNKEVPKNENGRQLSKRNLYNNTHKAISKRKPGKPVIDSDLDGNETDGYEEDDDDDETVNVSRSGMKIPRVQISDGAEGCICFPKRSNKNLPAMLYEGLECKHSGLMGEVHAGACKFKHNWDQEFEDPDPTSVMPQKTNYVLGYPRPVNLDQDMQYFDENYDPEEYNRIQTRDSNRNTAKSKKSDRKTPSENSKKKKSKTKSQPFPYGLLDFMEEEDNDHVSPPESRALPITLPRIGYSPPPPPSRERLPSRERHSSRSVAKSLPPLPESPFLSGHQNIKTSRSEKQNVPDINEVSDEETIENEEKGTTRQSKTSQNWYKRGQRRFKGHLYDPGSKKTTSYEIMPNFKKGLGEWNAYIGDKNRQNFMSAALNGRKTTNGNFYLRENSAVLEDDEYDDDEDDYDDNNSNNKNKKLWSKT